jgi:hypothetical protein
MPTITPVSILPSKGAAKVTAPAKKNGASRLRGRRGARERADWMSGRAPREIERLMLSETTEMHLELAAAGLL